MCPLIAHHPFTLKFVHMSLSCRIAISDGKSPKWNWAGNNRTDGSGTVGHVKSGCKLCLMGLAFTLMLSGFSEQTSQVHIRVSSPSIITVLSFE